MPVLSEEEHEGDIQGALGTIRVHDEGPRRSWRGRALTLLAIIGPGLIVMVGDNDAGGVSTYAQAGQNFGLSLLWMWVSLHRLGLYGTRWVLLVAYLGLFLPFGVRVLAIAFRQFDPVLEEAGRMSGASRARVSMRIVTPILAPAVLSGATVILYHSMRELSASLLLFTPDWTPSH